MANCSYGCDKPAQKAIQWLNENGDVVAVVHVCEAHVGNLVDAWSGYVRVDIPTEGEESAE